MDETDVIRVPIDGVLDLHTFQPREVGSLIPDYLEECRRMGILQVRIIHGKGQGILQRRVHAILKRLPWVSSFRLADAAGGGWGATLAQLKPLRQGAEPPEEKKV
ncbi:MAG: Smr/MutS family protein [Desulfuromonadaceae bacterium]|jgi:dsDNA-specific endonuclease/ATPase MutS2